MIEMLHSCEAGEKSVLTVYPAGYKPIDPMDTFGPAIMEIGFYAMRWFDFSDTLPLHGGTAIHINRNEF